MNTNTKKLLAEIGNQLDRGQFPCVYDGGLVWPDDTAVDFSTQGKESRNDERSESTRSKSRSWQRSPGRQGQTGRQRATPGAPPVISQRLRDGYRRQRDVVSSVYPGTLIDEVKYGMWLTVESKLLEDLNRSATFLIFVPYSEGIPVRAWGFWSTAVSFDWIGPRHTNFPEGSICAFEPTDNTWLPGGNLIPLIDLYSLWAVRHLHLEQFGFWPGDQYVVHPYERLTELKDHEKCGCGSSDLRYHECCKSSDMAQDRIELMRDFQSRYGIKREPPRTVLSYIRTRKQFPLYQEMYEPVKPTSLFDLSR